MTHDDTRHLLRRLAFASTPSAVRAIGDLSPDAAIAALVRAAERAPAPEPPVALRAPWTNTALRLAGTPPATAEAARAAQVATHREGLARLREWWIAEMIATSVPLRETMVLFLQNTFGSSTSAVEIPHALHGCNALLRRHALGSFPALLEQLVRDPAMMIQIGLDEHFRIRVSDRPAKLVLDRWTVGAGAYTEADLEDVSRALTGWMLAAPPGQEPSGVDPSAPRVARRTGLVPLFDEGRADRGSKTILGTTRAFDAVTVVGYLARHPATAARIGRRLVDHFAVDDPHGRLAGRLESVYRETDGSLAALLVAMVRSGEFWSESSRWTLVKSPVHLAVGACRQLELTTAPLGEMARWLSAAGQALFDTPSGGEASWPGQNDWVTPPDRLAVRYQLPWLLAGRPLRTGVHSPVAPPEAAPDLPIGAALRRAAPPALVERLDPAPGLDAAGIARDLTGSDAARRGEIIRRIMTTPNYQLA